MNDIKVVETRKNIRKPVDRLILNRQKRVMAVLICGHECAINIEMPIKKAFLEQILCPVCNNQTEIYEEAMRVGAGIGANYEWTSLEAARKFIKSRILEVVPEELPARVKKRFQRGVHCGFFKYLAPNLDEIE